MKLKTSTIALAVAGTLATPMAAQADLYASARIGINNVDTGGESELSVGGVASRFGIRQEFDLGNGMTSYGRYEWSVQTEGTNTSPSSDTIGRRHAYVGLKGDFGNVYLGQTNHEFFKHLVGPLDNPWVGSGVTMVDYLSRDAEQISYATSFGAVSLGASAVLRSDATAANGLDGLDGFELAVSVPAGDLGTVAVGIRSLEDADDAAEDGNDLIGITWHGIALGDATFGIGYQQQHDDTSIVLDLGINGIYVHYETLDCDADSVAGEGSPNCATATGFAADTSPSVLAVGYTQSLGRNTSMWYEAHQIDADSGDSDDDVTGLYATLKVDFN